MKEYIEREEVKRQLRIWIKEAEEDMAHDMADCFRDCIDLLDDVPAADVVEVVRCEDCKYCVPATADGAEYELCTADNDVFPVSVQKQHFCGRGKRKEG